MTAAMAKKLQFWGAISYRISIAFIPVFLGLLAPGAVAQGTSVTLSPTSLSFALEVVGTTSATQSVTLTNTGTATLNITSIAASNSNFSTPSNTCGSSVAAGTSCTISVDFTPQIAGARSATLSVEDDGIDSPQTVSLSGQATDLSLASSSVNFGSQTVGTTSAPQNVTVTNVASTSVSITGISISGNDPADFAQTNTCGSSLAGGANCTISVTFTPSTTGSLSARVIIANNGGFSSLAIALKGNGTSSTITVVVHPNVSPVTFTGSIQFTAQVTGSSNQLNWYVDSIPNGNSTVGTINTTGLYVPPQTTGSHTIEAEVRDTSASGTATAVVTNYAGVLTYQNDNQRDGLNSQEILLTPTNVVQANFGKLFTYSVDGEVRAQPLYIANLSIPGAGYHNVVYVATEHDSVFAFDADGRQTTPLWQVNFTDASNGVTTIPSSAFGSFCNYCLDQPEFGITATPVIDPTTNTIFVEARTQEVSGSTTTYVHQVHALDLTTGEEKFGGPVVIAASVAGTGSGSQSGVVSFDGFYEMVRPALLLSNGVVYIASASLGDELPYHGWVIGYNSQTLAQEGVFNSTPNGKAGGIWQNAAGMATDTSGNIFFQTGNGTFDANTGGSDYSESVIELVPNSADGSLSVGDYFTPYTQNTLTVHDWDMASAGITVLPDQPGPYPHLAIGGGKAGTIYLLNRDDLGGYNSSTDQVVQELVGAIRPSSTTQDYGIWNTAAFWNGYVYIFGQHDVLKVFQLTNGVLSSSPVSEGVLGMSAPVPVVSANGTTNGVLWVLEWEHSILRAYNASGDVLHELYDTDQDASRDALDGVGVKTMPIVANGRVYVGTSTNLDVYGPLP
jgi:hypothetical protein